MRALTAKESAFVAQLLIDWNGKAAATRAGYSARTAHSIANELLKRPHVMAAVDEAKRAQLIRLNATADDVLKEIGRMAMFDPAELTHVRRVSDIAKLPPDVRRAITGWSWSPKGHLILKLAKETALQMLGRHHKLFTDKVQVEVIDRAGALTKARQRAKDRGDPGTD